MAKRKKKKVKFENLTPEQQEDVLMKGVRIIKARKWKEEQQHLLNHQKMPKGDWLTWVILGGRGAGKTYAGAYWTIRHLRKLGKKARVGVGGRTIGDVREVCAFGESGLLTLYGSELKYNHQYMKAVHRDGGVVYFFGAESPDKWRGYNLTMAWCDELASWPEETYDMMRFCVRSGADPRVIVTTTPKNRKFIKEMLDENDTVVTRGSTKMNPHLNKTASDFLYNKYGGSRLGRQELDAEILEDIEGAIFKREWIDNARVKEAPPLNRVSVWIDPAVTTNKKSAETGITVAGRGEDGHVYILANAGEKAAPDVWGRTVFTLYDHFECDFIGCETNQGGDLLENSLRIIRKSGWRYETVHAKRGKFLRADPVAVLYEQGRIHHVGDFPELEDQMCSFAPGEAVTKGEKLLLDRLDSMVYAVTSLAGKRKKLALVASI